MKVTAKKYVFVLKLKSRKRKIQKSINFGIMILKSKSRMKSINLCFTTECHEVIETLELE